MKEPYNSTTLLPFDDHGWFALENQNMLRFFIVRYSPKIIVELGSWLGKSTRFMAEMLPQDGKLYAVDKWEGITGLQKWKDREPTLYQQFLSNVIHAELTEKIVPVRMTTQKAAKHLDIRPDLVYVDASHQEQDVLADIRNWYSKLAPGGIICGDDYAQDYPGVMNAVVKTSKEFKNRFRRKGRFWWFNPKPKKNER